MHWFKQFLCLSRVITPTSPFMESEWTIPFTMSPNTLVTCETPWLVRQEMGTTARHQLQIETQPRIFGYSFSS